MPTIRANNSPILDGKESSFLVSSPAAGSGTVTVIDYSQFSVGQYILIGHLGNEASEIIRIHTSTAPTSDGVITLATNTVYAHSINDPVAQIDFNQIEFSRATTLTGSKSVLTTSNIEADDIFTSYLDTANTTGYAFIRYKNSSTNVFSGYSSPILYAGILPNSVAAIKKKALGITHERIGDLITDDFLLEEIQNAQDEVVMMKDWDFEMTSNDASPISILTGQTTYTLPSDLKYPSTNRGILEIKIPGKPALNYVDMREYRNMLNSSTGTTLATDIALIDTTVTVVDASSLNSSGTIIIGDGSEDEISYTAISGDTLTGVTGISSIHSSGAAVWQSTATSEPKWYTVYDGDLHIWPVPSTDFSGLSLIIDYWKTLTALTDDSSTTDVSFYPFFQYYLAWKIEDRKRNADRSDRWRQIWENRLKTQMTKRRDRQFYRIIPNIGTARSSH